MVALPHVLPASPGFPSLVPTPPAHQTARESTDSPIASIAQALLSALAANLATWCQEGNAPKPARSPTAISASLQPPVLPVSLATPCLRPKWPVRSSAWWRPAPVVPVPLLKTVQPVPAAIRW